MEAGLLYCELMEFGRKGLDSQGPREVAAALPASCFRIPLGRGLVDRLPRSLHPSVL